MRGVQDASIKPAPLESFQRALDRGASSLKGPQDMPYGDFRAMIRDAWGNTWQIATHRGDFTP